MNDKKAKIHALWRAAYAAAEPTTIDCGTQSNAIRFRLDMYNAVKKVRKGDEGDAKLREAVENMMLTVDPENKAVIVLRKKLTDLLTQQIDAILKKSGEKLIDPNLAGADESFARLQKMMEAEKDPNITIPMPDGKTTPYY